MTLNQIKVNSMKLVLSISAAVLGIAMAVVPLVRGQTAPDRPQGVAAGAWISLNPRLGFVVAPPAKVPMGVGANAQALVLAPPVEGYFMIKGATTWSRVVITEPSKGPGPAG